MLAGGGLPCGKMLGDLRRGQGSLKERRLIQSPRKKCQPPLPPSQPGMARAEEIVVVAGVARPGSRSAGPPARRRCRASRRRRQKSPRRDASCRRCTTCPPGDARRALAEPCQNNDDRSCRRCPDARPARSPREQRRRAGTAGGLAEDRAAGADRRVEPGLEAQYAALP